MRTAEAEKPVGVHVVYGLSHFAAEFLAANDAGVERIVWLEPGDDGSIQFFSNTVSLNLWQALGTMNGAEVIDENE